MVAVEVLDRGRKRPVKSYACFAIILKARCLGPPPRLPMPPPRTPPRNHQTTTTATMPSAHTCQLQQGVNLSSFGVVEHALDECARRIASTISAVVAPV